METQYLAIAIQYYLAGRSATFANSVPVAGNLFHHAMEMLLKFFLIKHSYTPKQLKKIGHDLEKLWKEVKFALKDPGLDKFDDLIAELNPFEDLRYPGQGYVISISIHKDALPPAPNTVGTKEYRACLEDIDECVSALLKNRVTPGWIQGLMKGDVVEQYRKDNKYPYV